METLQKLSRESLRLNAAPQPPPPGPIIYETSKQVKKAYSRRKGNITISEAEKRRIERIKVLDERAEKIRQKEVRKKENALKRKAKEEKAGGPVGKRIARITSSQPELSRFFMAKKGGVSSGPVKRGLDYSAVEVEVGREEPEEVADVEVSEGEEEETVVEEKEEEKEEVKSDILAERSIDDDNVLAVSPATLVEEHEVESFAMGQKATMRLHSQLALLPPSSGSRHLTAGRLTERASLDDINLLSSSAGGLPDVLPRGIPKSSPPQPIYAQDPPSEPAEEQSEAEREENERVLEILREETDYNDFDDDYDLEDDPGFDYDYAEGPTSPAVCEAEDETTYGDGELDITSSDEAYGIGLSDPAFDELHDAFCEHEEVHAEESEQGFDSSFLCQAFDDDLRELEEDF